MQTAKKFFIVGILAIASIACFFFGKGAIALLLSMICARYAVGYARGTIT